MLSDLGNLGADRSLLLNVWKGNNKHMAVETATCEAVPKPCNIYLEQQLLEETWAFYYHLGFVRIIEQ